MISQEQLEKIYWYVLFCAKEKEARPGKYHRKYKPFKKRQSTYDLLRKAIIHHIYLPPRLLCLQDVEVKFIEYSGVPRIDIYKEKKNDPNVTYVLYLVGAYSLIYFKYGKPLLKYANCIIPSYPGIIDFNEINPAKYKKEKIKEMSKPRNWDDLHWGVYEFRNNPLRPSIKVGEDLGVSYRTVLDRYYEILKDCIMWIPFFPNGYTNYTKFVLTLKTDYEVGLLNELKKLDRSSYVYKADDTLILILFFNRELEIDSFLKMEENGIVHDLRISFPLHFYNIFEEDTNWD